MATYTCKWCGLQSSNSYLAGAPCPKSPHKQHELMNATEKLSQYTCKHCGLQSSNSYLAGAPCPKSPHKQHELLG